MQSAEENVIPRETERPLIEEIANTATHGLGLMLSLLGGLAMIATLRMDGSGYGIACGIYVASLIAVYAISTLSHAVQQLRYKYLLRVWDQGAIYLLIAGTYTPFMWAFLPDTMQWPVLLLLWGAALAGFLSKVFVQHQVEIFSSLSYVLLGWVPALALMHYTPLACMFWLALGGLSYTLGTWFLKMDRHYRYFHAAWHMMVIAGSACHFYAIFTFVVRQQMLG